MNIAYWLHSSALLRPQEPALFFGESLIANYKQFADRSYVLGKFLESQLGIKEGDRVAIYMPNCVEYLVILYACWWIGAVVVPVNYMLHPKEASWIIQNSESRLVFTDIGDVFINFEFQVPLHEIGINSGLASLLDTATVKREAPRTLDSSNLAWLFYTSGTTGRPKGAMLTHNNLIAMALSYFSDVDYVDASQSKLYAAPMSHGAGLYNFMFVRAGARHVVPRSRGFNSTEIINLAEKLRKITFFAAPTMCKRLVQKSIEVGANGDGIHLIVLGGGPMYVADFKQAIDVLGPKIAQIYGQGESPMTITAMPTHMISNKYQQDWYSLLSSVGRPHSCIELRIVDRQLRDLPIGQSGEILVRGPTVMKGYWRDRKATSEAIINGWLRTGDIGFLNEQGLLTLTDRASDLIISGGANIYPREIEEVLILHPNVFESAVIGVPSFEWGEEVVAFIVPKEGMQIDTRELEQWCRQHIASYKKPKHYIFVNELPKNSYGKVLKNELRQQLRINKP